MRSLGRPVNSGRALALCLLAGFAAPPARSALRAGAGRAVITPPALAEGRTRPPVWLAGFDSGRAATGVRDDIEARALILDDGRTRLGVVALDLIGLFHEEVMEIRREAADAGLRLDGLIVACTHNHNGPDTLGLWGRRPLFRGVSDEYLRFLRERILRALREADESLVPVRVTLARGAAPELVHDYRKPFIKDDGFEAFEFSKAGTGVVLATVVSWGNHPETLGSRNTLLTSDFPHAFREALEKERGGTVVYLSSSVGGMMSPLGIHVTDPEGRPIPDATFEKADRIGRLLARKVSQALRTSARPVRAEPIEFRARTLLVPLENRLFRLVARLGVIRRMTFRNGRPASRWWMGPDVQTEVNLVRLGEIAIATVPGELFPELEPELPAAVAWGLANDEVGYILPASDYVPAGLFGSHEKGHYEESLSLGPSTAERVLEALRQIAHGNPLPR